MMSREKYRTVYHSEHGEWCGDQSDPCPFDETARNFALEDALKETIAAVHEAAPHTEHTPFDNFEHCPNDLCRKVALLLDPKNDGNIILRTLDEGEKVDARGRLV